MVISKSGHLSETCSIPSPALVFPIIIPMIARLIFTAWWNHFFYISSSLEKISLCLSLSNFCGAVLEWLNSKRSCCAQNYLLNRQEKSEKKCSTFECGKKASGLFFFWTFAQNGNILREFESKIQVIVELHLTSMLAHYFHVSAFRSREKWFEWSNSRFLFHFSSLLSLPAHFKSIGWMRIIHLIESLSK